MSYSHVARERRRAFERSDYTLLLKYVYYLGAPPQNERTEFFDREHLAIAWIQKYTKLKLVSSLSLEKRKGKEYERLYPNCVISMDIITLYWDYTFHLNDNNIVYYGYACVADSHVIISAGRYTAYIYDGAHKDEISEDEHIYDFQVIHFTAPLPQLESMIIIDEYNYKTLYPFHIQWDNTRVRSVPNSVDVKKIVYSSYYIDVYDAAEPRAHIVMKN